MKLIVYVWGMYDIISAVFGLTLLIAAAVLLVQGLCYQVHGAITCIGCSGCGAG
jgi:hypothetical protein